MATRQYIGARYIPVFADPVEWDDTRAYEYLTMVQHVGETFMSKQNVPIGAPLPDTEHGEESTQYWVHMSNWNAQVETYRQEVLQYNGRISTLEDDLPIASFSSENTVKDAIDDLGDLLPASSFDSTNTVDARFDTIEANNWVTNARIADSAISISKLDSSLKGNLFNFADTIHTNCKELVWIGDSYSEGYQDSTGTFLPEADRIPNLVAANLGMNIHTFAAGGAGISMGYPSNSDNTFVQLIDTAIADTSFDKNEVGLVVIFGGRNDVNTNATNINNSVDYIINTAHTNYPNARIFYCMDYDWGRDVNLPGEEQNMFNNTTLIYRRLEEFFPYVLTARNSWTWFLGRPDLYDSRNIHPNEKGCRAFAQMITQCIIGGSDDNGDYYYGFDGNWGYKNGYVGFARRHGSMLEITMSGVLKQSFNGNFAIAVIPDLGCFGRSVAMNNLQVAFINQEMFLLQVERNASNNLQLNVWKPLTGSWADAAEDNDCVINIVLPFQEQLD